MHRPNLVYFVAAFLLLALLETSASAQSTGKPGPSGKPGNVVDYNGLLRLLEQKVPQKKIILGLRESSTHFTLSNEQIKRLRAKGATEELIRELRKLSVRPVPSDVRNIAIVLDCSGSMFDKIDGRPKMELAKEVVVNFVQRIRNGRNLAFIVYGRDPSKKCEDVEVLLPLTEVTDEVKNKLVKAVQQIEPAGHTPLAKSMEVAGAELARSRGLCMLVVITDGMESCKGDPGKVADKLVATLNFGDGGVDLVGLGVEAEEMAALKKLDRKSLKVVEASKATDLAESLNKISKEREELARKRKERAEKLAKDLTDRKKKAKARSGPLEISLAWSTKNDLDLHVVPPSGEEIAWNHKKSKDGGALDVDMNVNYDRATIKPMEHIVWEKKAPRGRYKVYVDNFNNHNNKPNTTNTTRFVVTVQTKDQLEWFEDSVVYKPNPNGRKKLVAEFDLDDDGTILVRYTPQKKAGPGPKKDTSKKDGKPSAALDPASRDQGVRYVSLLATLRDQPLTVIQKTVRQLALTQEPRLALLRPRQ